MRSHAAVPVLLAFAAVLATAGCTLLDYPAFPDDDFGRPGTKYTSGRATVMIGDEKHVLDQVSGSSQLMSGFGAEVYWFNEEGWGLRLSGGTGGLVPATISVDRIRTTYWSASDYLGGRCKVKLDQVDEQGVKGTAACTDLQWSDMLRGDPFADDGHVEGEPPFDATIEFEAVPDKPAA
jgi:hypothetical protein